MEQEQNILEEYTTRNVYNFIIDYSITEGFAPTQREMSIALKLSRGGVAATLKRLEKYGYISRAAGKPRAIKLCHYSLVEAL